MKRFCDVYLEWMKAKGLTHPTAAEFLGISVATSYVYAGGKAPRVRKVQFLARLMGMDPSSLAKLVRKERVRK